MADAAAAGDDDIDMGTPTEKKEPIESMETKDDADDSEKLMSDSEEEDSSDDDEGDMDAQDAEELQRLDESLQSNPYEYSLHVQLIGVLRRQGMLDKLRAARETMATLFPLSANLWREWAHDEARLVSSQADAEGVASLYDRAVEDYLSIPVWQDYLAFVQERIESLEQCTPQGVTRMRSLFERALAAGGIHFLEGHGLWKSYREWENALVLAEDDVEARKKQKERVGALFRRQLAVPLANHADTLAEFKVWLTEGSEEAEEDAEDAAADLSWLPSDLSLAYKKAAAMAQARAEMEKKISTVSGHDAEVLAAYMNYVLLEEGTGDPVRVQNVYERAVAVFPVTADVWLKYIGYVQAQLKVPAIIRRVHARAVRNCPWVGELWRSYLLALERTGIEDSLQGKVFQTALQGGLQTAEEYLSVGLCHIDALRRQVARGGADADKLITTLRSIATQVKDLLGSHFPDFVDRSLQLHAYWADIEATLVGDLAAARVVWDDIIKASGWMTEAWQGYIAMEVRLGNVKEARALYRQCYSRRLEGNGTEAVCAAWLRFERERGTLEDYDFAVAKVTPRLAEVRAKQEIEDAKEAAARDRRGAGTGGSALAGPKQVPSKSRPQGAALERTMGGGPGKRKMGLGYRGDKKEEKAVPVKKRKEEGQEEEGQDGQVADQGEDGMNGEGEDLEMGEDDKEGEGQAGEGAKGKRPVYKDECTAFVWNLAFEVQENDIREQFSSCGGIKDVRLVKDRYSGRSKGYAYIEFENQESLNAALEMHQVELKGRPMLVEKSAPPGRGGRGGGRGGDRARGGRGRGPRGQGRGGFGSSRSEWTEGGYRERGGYSGRGQRGITAPPTSSHRRGGHVQLTPTSLGVPRSVSRRPLGWGAGGSALPEGETLQTNEEFRKMLMKKE